MRVYLIKKYYEANNLPEDKMRQAMRLIMELNEQIDYDVDAIDEAILDDLILYLRRTNANTIESFVTMMRYFRMIDRKDLFIHLTKYTGMLGVMDQIIERLRNIHGTETCKKVLGDFLPPVLGTKPDQLPLYAKTLMELLEKNLKKKDVETVLQGNNHQIPETSILPEKVEYENAKTLEQYLKDRHERKVEELTTHMKENKVWFEQVITKEVVDYVKSNQEILSARLENDKLYITKIPFDTENYLAAKDPVLKKFYACHCPFARESIKTGDPKVSKRFCHCSAGFAKYPFEVILGQPLKAKVLKSALGEHDICRFEIDLTKIDYKK